MSRERPARLPACAIPLLLVVLTACGGGETKGDGTASAARPEGANVARGAFYDAQLKYTQCMRRNGLPEFPDPLSSGHMDRDRATALYERLQNGSRAEMERNQRTRIGPADKACDRLYRAAQDLAPRRNLDRDLDALRRHATCLRKRGVDITDPRRVGDRIEVGDTPNPTSPKVSRSSPEYKRAQSACRSLLSEGLHQ